MNPAGVAFSLTLSLLSLNARAQDVPDFGADGLVGLTDAQKHQLARGEIVLPEEVVRDSDGKRMIEAALIFIQPPEKTWSLLARAEDQVKYLDEVKKIAVISREPEQAIFEFTTKILTKTLVYRLRYFFNEGQLYLCWSLDPSLRSEVKELTGFWRFYPYPGGRTLARYGTRFATRFIVPKFIVTALAKHDLRSALRSVKKYVDSDGTWEKSQK